MSFVLFIYLSAFFISPFYVSLRRYVFMFSSLCITFSLSYGKAFRVTSHMTRHRMLPSQNRFAEAAMCSANFTATARGNVMLSPAQRGGRCEEVLFACFK
jgi:hypothetical protein